MKEIINQAKELLAKIDDAWQWLNLESKIKKIQVLDQQLQEPDFWSNRQQATLISKEQAELQTEVDIWLKLRKDIAELLSLAQLADKEKDNSMTIEFIKKLKNLATIFNKLSIDILLAGEYDKASVILSIYAGAGGTDAQDWTAMLERMLLRYGVAKDFKTTIIDRQVGSEAGIKSVTIHFKGKFAYGWLKSEAGVHRLVRISPFDAEKMRHTSFAMVEVLPELVTDTTIELKDEDLEITTAKSSGPGGQGVNTTDSAVRIKHKSTGITVRCQNERSQLQNKETALKILKSKLQQYNQVEQEEERQKIRGEFSAAAWGNQIRSYVFHPYKLVKDHRTNYETQEINKILDGELDDFVMAYLEYFSQQHKNKKGSQ